MSSNTPPLQYDADDSPLLHTAPGQPFGWFPPFIEVGNMEQTSVEIAEIERRRISTAILFDVVTLRFIPNGVFGFS